MANDANIQNIDELLFVEEDSPETAVARTWKLMIVDDEPEVHDVTQMVFSEYSFDGAGLKILNAYSGEEANKLMEEHPDTAVILLDVVMETDQAGLDVVRHIRDELQNKMVRIILRTGQPGQAPEKK
jgi:CheY-like chemotaxis protein